VLYRSGVLLEENQADHLGDVVGWSNPMGKTRDFSAVFFWKISQMTFQVDQSFVVFFL